MLQYVAPFTENLPKPQISQSSNLLAPNWENRPAGQSGHRTRIVGMEEGISEGIVVGKAEGANVGGKEGADEGDRVGGVLWCGESNR